MPSPHVVFRVAYARYDELRDDVAQQMSRGGLLVKVHDAPGLGLDSPVDLELVLPDGTTLQSSGRVLQIFAGFGVAVSVEPTLVDRASQCASRPEIAATGSARHEWIDRIVARRGTPTQPPPLTTPPARHVPAATAPFAARSRPSSTPPPASLASPPATRRTPTSIPPSARPAPGALPVPGSSPRLPIPAGSSPMLPVPGGSSPAVPSAIALGSSGPAKPEVTTRNEKIQKALHGTRDERNAILRDRDRTLHPFVLKNPGLDADDVLSIAKNAMLGSDLLKLIGERRDWVERPAIAIALARNPKTPSEIAVRALDHVPLEALRQMAKGGVLPHVTQAARKKLLG